MKRLILLTILLAVHLQADVTNDNLFTLPIPVQSLPPGSGNSSNDNLREEQREESSVSKTIGEKTLA